MRDQGSEPWCPPPTSSQSLHHPIRLANKSGFLNLRACCQRWGGPGPWSRAGRGRQGWKVNEWENQIWDHWTWDLYHPFPSWKQWSSCELALVWCYCKQILDWRASKHGQKHKSQRPEAPAKGCDMDIVSWKNQNCIPPRLQNYNVHLNNYNVHKICQSVNYFPIKMWNIKQKKHKGQFLNVVNIQTLVHTFKNYFILNTDTDLSTLIFLLQYDKQGHPSLIWKSTSLVALTKPHIVSKQHTIFIQLQNTGLWTTESLK